MFLINPFRYAAPAAYIRAHFSYLLDDHEWTRILRAESMGTFLDRLQETAYGRERTREKGFENDQMQAFGEMDPTNLVEIEKQLYARWARSARAPMVFSDGKIREVLEWQWRLFEIDHLKIILRGVDRGVPVRDIKASLIPLPKDTGLPWDALAESSSISEVASKLEDTPYQGWLDSALERYQRERERFVLEISIDLEYNRALRRAVTSLHGRDRREAERFLGNVIDSRLVIWSYRFREFAGMGPEEILNYTLDHGFRVSAEDVKAIATGAEIEEILPVIWDELSWDEILGQNQREAIIDLEVKFLRYRYHEAREIHRQPSFHLGLLLAYQSLLETEVLDLISVVECLDVGLTQEETRDHLIVDRSVHV